MVDRVESDDERLARIDKQLAEAEQWGARYGISREDARFLVDQLKQRQGHFYRPHEELYCWCHL